MPEDIQIVAPSTPISQAIDTFNQNGLKNKGKAIIAQFNKNEIDQIFDAFFSPRRWKRDIGLGNTLSTFGQWTHLKDNDGYAIWKIAAGDYSHHTQNNVYFDDIQLENRGEATSESATSFSAVFEDDGTEFIDLTSEADSEFGEPFSVLSAKDTKVLYIGSDTPFSGIDFSFETLGLDVTLSIEYSKGSDTWETPQGIVDETVNFTRSGRLRFSQPDDFALNTVNSEDKYWVKITTTTTPIIFPYAYYIKPLTSVVNLLSLSADQILQRRFAWVAYNDSIYVTLPNTGNTQAEGETFIKSSSSQQNKENYFVSNHQIKADYESYNYTILSGGFVSSIDYLPELNAPNDLNLKIRRGRSEVGNTYYEHANSSLLMDADTDKTYVFVNESGVLTQNTTGFPIVCYPIAEIKTDSSKITELKDRRVFINRKFDPLYVSQIGDESKRIPNIYADTIDAVTYKTGETIALQDNIWVINSDKLTGTPTEDMGFLFKRGDSQDAEFYFKESDTRFDLNFPLNVKGMIRHEGNLVPSENTLTIGTSSNRYAAVYLNSMVDYSSDLLFQSGGNTQAILKTDGYFGLGTASPESKLHIVDGGNSIKIGNFESSTAGIELLDNDPVYVFGWDDSLRFATGGATESYHRLIIDASGKVGIGTMSPTSQLTVVGGGAFSTSITTPLINPATLGTALTIQTWGGSASTGNITIQSGALSGNGGTTGTVLIKAGASSTSDGGYLSLGGYPNYNQGGSVTLRAGDSWANAGGLTFRGGHAGSGKGGDVLIQGGDGGSGLGGAGSITLNTGSGGSKDPGNILFKINGTEFARLHNNGYFGIGTDSPEDLFTVSSSDSSPILAIERASSSWEAQLRFKTGSTIDWIVFENDSGNDLQIQRASESDSAPRLRFSGDNHNILMALSGGKIGIGTTSPQAFIDLKAGNSVSNLMELRNESNTTVFKVTSGGTVNILPNPDVSNLSILALHDSHLNPSNQYFNGVVNNISSGSFNIHGSRDIYVDYGQGGIYDKFVIRRRQSWDGSAYTLKTALYLNDSGYVGIGTTIPLFPLHIYGVDSSFSSSLNLEAENPRLRFNTTTDNIRYYIELDESSQCLRFLDDDRNPRIVFRQSGAAGIGTVSPNAMLHVSEELNSGITDLLTLENTGENTGVGTRLLMKANGNEHFFIKTQDVGGGTYNSKVEIGMKVTSGNGNPASTIMTFSDGNVGVGTDSPSPGGVGGRTLHLVHSDGTASLRVERSDASVQGSISITSGNYSNSIFSTGEKDFVFHTNSIEISRFTSAGRLGLGLSTPTQVLHVYHASDNSVAKFESGDSGVNIRLADSDTTNDPILEVIGNRIQFGHVSGGAKVAITDTGLMGIGTTAPSYKLDISAANSGINISGGNSRIYFGGYRAMEGAQDGTSLQFGESYSHIHLRNSGYVSIGHVNPESELDIQGSTLTGVTATVLKIRTGTGVGKRAGYTISTNNGGPLGGMAAEVITDGVYPNTVGKVDFWVQNLNNSFKAITIDQNAFVGIGASAPSDKLHVADGAIQVKGVLTGQASSDWGALEGQDVFSLLATRQQNGTPSALGGLGMVFDGGYESPVLYCYDAPGNKIVFGSLSSTVGNRNLAEDLKPFAVFNADNGRVGFGTTDPLSELHIKSSDSNSGIYLEDSIGSISEIAGGTYGSSGNSKISFRTQESSGSLTTKMVIINDGKIGIGTTSPSEKLTIENGFFMIQSTGGGSRFRLSTNGGVAQVDSLDAGIPLSFNTQAVERMRITAGGLVGIGTTNPYYKLSVAGGIFNVEKNGDYYGFWVEDKARDDNPKINLGEWHNSRGGISYNVDGDYLTFDTEYGSTVYSNTLVLKDGKVGIGLTNPTRSLEINKTGGCDFEVESISSGSASILITGYSSSTNLATVSGGGKLSLQNLDGTNNNYSSITFLDNGGQVTAAVVGVNENHSTNAGVLTLHYRPSGGNLTEGARLTSSGNFAIYNQKKIVLNQGAGGNNFLQSPESDTSRLGIFTANSERISIAYSSGYVGIGKTDPASMLDVRSTGGVFRAGRSNTATLGEVVSWAMMHNWEGTDEIGVLFESVIQDASVSSRKADLSIRTQNQGITEKVRITYDGKVGIGTSVPYEKLDVYGNAKITNGDGTAALKIYAYDVSGGSDTSFGTDMFSVVAFGGRNDAVANDNAQLRAAIGSDSVIGNLKFAVSSTSDLTNISNFHACTRMTITNNGLVGLGITDPSANLHLYTGEGEGYVDSYANLLIEGTDSRIQLLSTNSGVNGSAVILSNVNTSWGFHQRTSSLSNRLDIGFASISGQVDILANMNATITLLPSGNVGINTTNPNQRLHVAGGHILIDNNYELRFLDSSGNNRTALWYTDSNNLEIWNTGGRILFQKEYGVKELSSSPSELSGFGLLYAKTDGNLYYKTSSGIEKNLFTASSIWTLNGSDTFYSTGNVGIGTSSPSQKLEIYSSNDNAGLKIHSDGTSDKNPFIYLDGTSGRAGYIRGLTNGSSATQINLYSTDDANSRLFSVASNGGFGDSSAEFMILQNGNTGIGTISPTHLLHLKGSNAKLKIESSGSTDLVQCQFTRSDGSWVIGTESGSARKFIIWNSVSGKYVTVSDQGYFGINTTTPTAMLEIAQSSNTDWTAYIRNGGGSGKGLLVRSGSASSVPVLQVNDNYDSVRFLVQSDGKIGIGTSTPETLLELLGSSTQLLRLYENGGSNGDNEIGFYAKNGSGSKHEQAKIRVRFDDGAVDSEDSSFYFYTYKNGTQVLPLTLYGNTVGIGTSSPDTNYACHIASPGLSVNAQSGSQGLYVYRESTQLFNRITFDSSTQYSDWGTSQISIRQGGTERIRISGSGFIGLGTSSPASRLVIEDDTGLIIKSPTSGYGQMKIMPFAPGHSYHEFFTGSWEHVSFNIHSTANFGIGTTTPDSKLHVVGSIRAGTHPGSSPQAALELVSGGSGDYNKPMIALRQTVSEADTRIFADYGEHVGWGIYHRNSDNTIHFTNGAGTGFETWSEEAPNGSTDSVGSVFRINTGNGNTAIGGRLTLGDYHSTPSQLLYVRDDFGGSGPGTLVRFQNDHSSSSYGVVLDLFHTNTLDSDYGENSAIIRGGEGGTTKFYVSNRGEGYFAGHVKIGSMQAQREYVVSGLSLPTTGWYRVAKISGSAGRGQNTVTINTTGGDHDPRSVTIRWWHNWSSVGALNTISEYGNGYWSDARVTDDGSNSYLEVYFTTALTSFNVSLQYDGGHVGGEILSPPQSGGGTVRATTRLGRFSIGQSQFFLTSGSYVGIGTDNPETHVHIYDSSGIGQGALRVHAGSGEATIGLGVGNSSWSSSRRAFIAFEGWSLPDSHLGIGDASFPAINIDTVNGKVGIGLGTTSPNSFDSWASTLVVGNGSTHDGITIFGQSGHLFFADAAGGSADEVARLSYTHSTNTMSIYTNNAQQMTIDSDGDVTIKRGLTIGNVSQADNMGWVNPGLTIGYSTNSTGDTGFLACRNPDVSHGVTGITSTDVFFFCEERNMDMGGVSMWGLAESSTPAIGLYGVNSTPSSATSNAAEGVINIIAYKRSGTGVTSIGDNDNILCVKNWGGTTRHIFKGDGDLYTDTGSVSSYDAEDDLKLVETARNLFDGKQVLKKYKDRLEELGIMKGGFMSHNKMHSLNLGALGQLFNVIRGLAKKMGVTEEELLKMAKEYA